MLKKCTAENTPKFSLAGEYQAKVLNIVDGDTLDVAIKVSKSKASRVRVRLTGIDAPETRTKNVREKEAGKRSKKELSAMVADKMVKLIAGEFDDFGRILGHVVVDGSDVATELVAGGFAKNAPDGHQVKFDEEKPKQKKSAPKRTSTPFKEEEED